VSRASAGRESEKRNKQLKLITSELPRVLAGTLLRFQRGHQGKYVEKLDYIHYNPVKRGLVSSPELWPGAPLFAQHRVG